MDSDRRNFLKRTATTAAALTLGSAGQAAASPNRAGANFSTGAAPGTESAARAAGESALANERRLQHARSVPLEKVRVTGGPLKHAQELDAAYLLSLEPDRMLAYYRVRAGLEKKAEPYTGWDGGGRNLTGHIAGHYLSAVSLMYAATGDQRFRERATYIVRELDEVQRKNGDGYVGALEGLREAYAALSRGEIRSGGFDLNGLWSPWYTLHKTYAGLRDAYRYTGNTLALQVETKYAAWAERVLAPLDEAQVQKMLNTEHGGMNEVLADLYADTGDARWLSLSRRFEHHAFTGPLERHQDNLSGKHGNCQVPKLIGSAARYGYTGEASDYAAAAFFWDRVVQHHSYASGGHGLSEYFGPPDDLSVRVDGRAAETCNVYNMIKLTRRLFALRPDAAYADFQERALFNHILASMDPEDGRTSYMVPVGRGVQQEYQDMQRDFTCCVGTGMESHALHGLGIWYESNDTIWANLFVPSIAQCTLAGARLEMKTDFPDGFSAVIEVTVPKPATFTLAVRRPAWAGSTFEARVNGDLIEQPPFETLFDPVAGGRAGGVGNEAARSSTYVSITRTWKSGDVVYVHLPKYLHLEPTQDNPHVTAIMWGPLALAADLGPRDNRRGEEDPSGQVPVIVAATREPSQVLEAADRAGDFHTRTGTRWLDREGEAPPMHFAPFYRTHRRTYSLYVDLHDPLSFASLQGERAGERARAAAMDGATIGRVVAGDAESEKAANYQSEPKGRPATRANRRTFRGGPGWFSYELKVNGTVPMTLAVTYFNEHGLPAPLGDFAIVVDGTPVAHYAPNEEKSGFYEAVYAVPSALTLGKKTVTVRFEAAAGGRIVAVYGVRSVRS